MHVGKHIGTFLRYLYLILIRAYYYYHLLYYCFQNLIDQGCFGWFLALEFAINQYLFLMYRTAIVALGHIAFHMPDKFPVQVKNRVSRNIVKELLMQDKTEPRSDDGTEWCEFDDLPLETKCKIEGMKMMARWLVGLKVKLKYWEKYGQVSKINMI